MTTVLSPRDPLVRKIPWRRKWQPTAVFLPGKPQGQRSLVGYSIWVSKESDTTERLLLSLFINYLCLPRWYSGQESACQCSRWKRLRFNPWVQKKCLEKEMATHSSTLAWKIPWTEDPGRLQYMRSQRVRHN